LVTLAVVPSGSVLLAALSSSAAMRVPSAILRPTKRCAYTDAVPTRFLPERSSTGLATGTSRFGETLSRAGASTSGGEVACATPAQAIAAPSRDARPGGRLRAFTVRLSRAARAVPIGRRRTGA
jgi:hypothetical protein